MFLKIIDTLIMRRMITLALFSLALQVFSTPTTSLSKVNENNQLFRDQIVHYLQGLISKKNNQAALLNLQNLDNIGKNYYQKTDWSVKVTLYNQGSQTGEGYAHGKELIKTLKNAAEQSLRKNSQEVLQTRQPLQFKVAFNYFPGRTYSFIDFDNKGIELVGNRVAVRQLTKTAIKQQIQNSQAYLLRVMHPQWHGFFKFYDANTNDKESLLRTIYSSSSLYTLLKLYHLNKEASIEQYFKPIAEFILSNQLKDGPNKGGFYYGFNPKTQKKVCKVIVGTTSKTIFTLLELNELYPQNPVYLQAAKLAGNWLLTKVHPDGSLTTLANCTKGSWRYSLKQSFLYSGQVLSALSRLYGVTHDSRYYQGATLIAQHFVEQIKTQGPLIRDDYRPANSISSSWIMMSLIDFAKVTPNSSDYFANIKQIATALAARQINNPEDIYNHGRYLDTMTTSGNGWINEVMGVLYEFCTDKQWSQCQQYRSAILLSSRWLLQNAYTKENTYYIKDPAMAIGGFINHFATQKVRTDAVCHGLNSLISLYKMVSSNSEVLLDVPERPLIELLPLLRAGNAFL